MPEELLDEVKSDDSSSENHFSDDDVILKVDAPSSEVLPSGRRRSGGLPSLAIGVEKALMAEAATAEWRDAICVQVVNEMTVTLSTSKELLKIKAEKQKSAAVMFESLFDKRKLVSCGFHERIDFVDMIKIISNALDGDESVTAQIEDSTQTDEIKLKITHSMVGLFEMYYTLPLSRKEIDPNPELTAELKAKDAAICHLQHTIDVMQRECEVVKAQNRHLQETMEAMKQEMIAIKVECDGRVAETMQTVEFLKGHIADLKAKRFESIAKDCVSDLRVAESVTEMSELKEDDIPPLPTAVSMISEECEYSFDTKLQNGSTAADSFQVDSDCKTAVSKKWSPSQIALKPLLVVSDTRTQMLRFRIEKKTGVLAVGFTDFSSKFVTQGCAFFSDGRVFVGGKFVASSRAFGGWQKGECILLTAFLDSGKVKLEAPSGHYTVHWTPQSPVVWAVLYTEKPDTSLSIV